MFWCIERQQLGVRASPHPAEHRTHPPPPTVEHRTAGLDTAQVTSLVSTSRERR